VVLGRRDRDGCCQLLRVRRCLLSMGQGVPEVGHRSWQTQEDKLAGAIERVYES
jgi:hypothetical protein